MLALHLRSSFPFSFCLSQSVRVSSLFSFPLSISPAPLRAMSKPPSAFDALMSGARAAAKKNSQSKPQTPKPPSSPKKRKSSHSTSSQNPSNKSPKLPSPPTTFEPEEAVKPEEAIKPEEGVKQEQRKVRQLSSSNGKTVELKKQVPLLKQKPSSFDPASVIAWEKGQPVPFLFLALTFDMISEETGRIVITDIVCNMLRTVMLATPEDLVPIVYLSANRIAPAHEGLELGIGESIISKALAEAYGRNEAWIKTQYQVTEFS